MEPEVLEPDFKPSCWVYPDLGGHDCGCFRLGGPGLGNLLLPWARAQLMGRRLGLPVLTACFRQLKWGPLWRRERDLRLYAGQFRERSCAEVAQFYAGRLRAQLRNELGQRLRAGSPGAPEWICVSGLGAFFHELDEAESSWLQAQLLDCVQPSFHPRPLAPETLALHVRRGDFREPSWGEKFPAQGVENAVRLPLSYFVDYVQNYRRWVHPTCPVMVYSDGSEQELEPLLALPGVQLARHQAAITELLEMSTAQALVLSPHSTFSMWAAYLGKARRLGFRERGGERYGLRLDCTSPEQCSHLAQR